MGLSSYGVLAAQEAVLQNYMSMAQLPTYVSRSVEILVTKLRYCKFWGGTDRHDMSR